jgi:hypothetical protein
MQIVPVYGRSTLFMMATYSGPLNLKKTSRLGRKVPRQCYFNILKILMILSTSA